MTSIGVDDVIDVLSILANDERLQVTVKESLKGGLITGLATVVGALLGGSRGIFVGALVGGAGAALYANGRFESVGAILTSMDAEGKKRLYDAALEIFAKFSINDLAALQRALTEPEARKELIRTVVDHVEQNMHMEIVH